VSREPDQIEPSPGARERILSTAYDLFARHGIRAIGVDRIISEAGVAKTTLYRHFQSKDDLVIAVLERREEIWLVGWLQPRIEALGDSPDGRLLAIFDAFGEWFLEEGYEGCLFVSSLIDAHDRTSPIGAESATRLANIRSLVRTLAEQAGVRDAHAFAHKWQLLMLGSIVQAVEGHPGAAQQARALGELLIEQEGLGAADGAAGSASDATETASGRPAS
jgi:AcrR family transcriptional regulator